MSTDQVLFYTFRLENHVPYLFIFILCVDEKKKSLLEKLHHSQDCVLMVEEIYLQKETQFH